VGRLVSMTTCSGGCRTDAMRMTGKLLASRSGCGDGLGKYQSARNSKARSNVPTQAMYRPIGITISRPAKRDRSKCPQFLTVRYGTWLPRKFLSTLHDPDTAPRISDQQHDQGDGKRCRRDEVREGEVREDVMDHAGAVPGAAILSFSSVQVLRTSAVISEQSSI